MSYIMHAFVSFDGNKVLMRPRCIVHLLSMYERLQIFIILEANFQRLRSMSIRVFYGIFGRLICFQMILNAVFFFRCSVKCNRLTFADQYL